MRHLPKLLAALLSVAGCSTPEQKPAELFTQLPSSQTGITFVNKNTEDVEQNILTYEYFYNGGGVAIGDINNDGLPDIYFSANQEGNKLYLNKGNLQFEDITEKAHVMAKTGWRTGVAMADVNGDGYLDIYVCRSGWQHPLFRTNALYINNKDLTFSDKAHEYGLDDDSYSTQAAFFDYDRDGDLDLFLLNHSRLMISNSYDISRRYDQHQRVRYVGNKLYRNDSGKFSDVSDSLGIYGPASNYGLGVAIADINNDGWMDLYTSNDYTEKDKVYLNERGKIFREASDSLLTHESQFSMGVDMADVNNDGWSDIVSLDMLPEENKRQKEFHWPDRYDVYASMVKSGLHHQYMRNMLHLNNGDGTFSETGQLAGISNTDWSWAALFADFDNDGLQDLFVSNGFKRNFTSNDFLKFNADRALKTRSGQNQDEMKEILGKMPSNKVHSYLFKNTDGLSFTDVSRQWGFDREELANGAAYADLDNDGDLDLVTNRMDEEAGIYRNNAEKLSPGNFLKVKLHGNDGNTGGIGAKITLYHKGKLMTRTLSPQRGFQSSVDPTLHFGLGTTAVIDSMIIEWPRGEVEKQYAVKTGQLLTVNQQDAKAGEVKLHKPAPLFAEKKNVIDVRHRENDFIDFKVQGLLPRMYSTEGPALAAADVNHDGLMDVYLGGAKGQAGALLVQNAKGGFMVKRQADLQADAGSEDTDALFFDMEGDGDQDLYVVSGGYEFETNDPLLQDHLYRNDGKGNFTKAKLPEMYSSGSCVRAADVDSDGDQDLFVGGRITPRRYPEAPQSYLLMNDGKGTFTNVMDQLAPSLSRAGMITDAAWVDLNKDSKPDLVVAGEWMPVTVYINENGKLVDRSAQYIRAKTSGWWSCLKVADVDNDGDPDLIAGNFGMNNQFKASPETPVTLYYADYDNNGSIDPIVNYFIGGKSYPLPTRDELADQVPSFKKKFTDYASYTEATINTILSEEQLKRSTVLTAHTFETVLLQNDGGSFTIKPLSREAQRSPVCAVHIIDVNKDGNPDLVTAGNLSATRSRFGKATGNFGSVFLGDGRGGFQYLPASGLCIRGDVRRIVQDGSRLIFSRNNDVPAVYELK